MKQKYLEVGRMMKDYEDTKYEQWRDMAEQVLPALMKKSLLAKVRVFQALVPGHVTGRCEAMAPVVSPCGSVCRHSFAESQTAQGRDRPGDEEGRKGRGGDRTVSRSGDTVLESGSPANAPGKWLNSEPRFPPVVKTSGIR